jgi:hypothetical protein
VSAIVVHAMDVAWTSSNLALLDVAADVGVHTPESPASNRLQTTGALNETASVAPPATLDLSGADELRFWIRSNRAARGTTDQPFYLEFAYTDANDTAADNHRWFVPVNRAGAWELRRIGIENERRTQVDGLEFRCISNAGFTCHIDDLLAVRGELLADAENALLRRVAGMTLPGVTDIALAAVASSPATSVEVNLNRGFTSGNRIVIRGGSLGDQEHNVASATHNTATGRTTLTFAPGETVVGTVPTTGTVSVLVPAFVQAPPALVATPLTPTILVTQLDAREDAQRTPFHLQRDSFRIRNGRTVCSVRPAAQAYSIDYQLTVVAPDRPQQQTIQEQLLLRFNTASPLRINGVSCPVWILAPPALIDRDAGQLAPTYVRVGSSRETAPRGEQTWVQRLRIDAAPVEVPADAEELVVDL